MNNVKVSKCKIKRGLLIIRKLANIVLQTKLEQVYRTLVESSLNLVVMNPYYLDPVILCPKFPPLASFVLSLAIKKSR